MFTLCLCTLNINNLVTFYSFSAGFALSLKAYFGHRLMNGSEAVKTWGTLSETNYEMDIAFRGRDRMSHSEYVLEASVLKARSPACWCSEEEEEVEPSGGWEFSCWKCILRGKHKAQPVSSPFTLLPGCL